MTSDDDVQRNMIVFIHQIWTDLYLLKTVYMFPETYTNCKHSFSSIWQSKSPAHSQQENNFKKQWKCISEIIWISACHAKDVSLGSDCLKT